jgi:hypothetical protein
MNNDWKPTEINEGQPTNWEPRKQHPEEVADGLRDAFRQAIKDGVMDATPYLKQMTFNNDIEKTEAEIKVLQAKLELLKEIEKHKSPVEEAYKDWWGEYPSTNKSVSETEDMRWAGFQAGFQAAYEEKVSEDNYYNEVAKSSKPQTLYEILCAEQGQFINREFICEIVEDWLPDEVEVDTEEYNVGWNDCLQKIKENLR